MQLIAIAPHPNLDTPAVDLVSQVAPGRFYLHERMCNEMLGGEGEKVDRLELMQRAAVADANIVMPWRL